MCPLCPLKLNNLLGTHCYIQYDHTIFVIIIAIMLLLLRLFLLQVFLLLVSQLSIALLCWDVPEPHGATQRQDFVISIPSRFISTRGCGPGPWPLRVPLRVPIRDLQGISRV